MRKLSFVCIYKILFVLAISSIISACNSISPLHLSNPTHCVANENLTPLTAHHIRVANWNVYKGKRHGWHHEIEQLNESSALIIMQEAPHHDATHTSLGEDHTWRFAPGYHDGNVQTGVLTSSHAQPSWHCKLSHDEPWLRTPKASLVTHYKIEGSTEELVVANIHAINFSFGVKHYRKQIEDLVHVLKKHTGPLILAGDFNSWNRRRMNTLNDAAEVLGLVRVDFDESKIKQFMGYPLDHIFYRGLTLTNQSVRIVSSSDHNMLIADFRL